MEIKCAWCEKIIGTKKFENVNSKLPLITHSICKSCQKKLFQDEHLNAALARKKIPADLSQSPITS
ncbi:MAG: hypothetical protein C4519_09695 [Desulfobacteraceae bacterium]|nr:MAG: hypothetical protein C4519_09695 [Desulfobacteraceae bacterium]